MKKRLLLLWILAMVFLASTSKIFATPIQWKIEDGGNGHWYDVAHMTINWTNAKALTESLFFNDYQGHLATITSALENLWLTDIFGESELHYHWLGGYQPPGSSEPDGGWSWVTGEEWNYDNWWYYEPNDIDTIENVLIFDHGITTDGKSWNDLDAPRLASGYVIEYEQRPIPEPSTIFLLYSGLIGFAFFRRRYLRKIPPE